MFGPNKIMKWCDNNLQEIRRSRRSALAAICAGAVKMKGVGALALARIDCDLTGLSTKSGTFRAFSIVYTRMAFGNRQF